MNIHIMITAARGLSEGMQAFCFKWDLKKDAKSVFKVASLTAAVADVALSAASFARFSLPPAFLYAQLATRAVIIVSGELIKNQKPRWSVVTQILAIAYQLLLCTKHKESSTFYFLSIAAAGLEFGFRQGYATNIYREARRL